MKYDISTVFNIILRTRIEIITERSDNNLTIILENRASSSELSDVSKKFKNITVNNDNNIKEL